jgi:hypothetical protein
MLSEEAMDAIARVVVARLTSRHDELDEGVVAQAYQHLLTLDQGQCNPESERIAEEFDRGQSVEYAVKRLAVGGATVAGPLLRRIVELCPRDRGVLGSVGAGMFEDWVTEERVASVEGELAELLRADAKWRVVAESSWDEPPSLVRLLADPDNLPTDPL